MERVVHAHVAVASEQTTASAVKVGRCRRWSGGRGRSHGTCLLLRLLLLLLLRLLRLLLRLLSPVLLL